VFDGEGNYQRQFTIDELLTPDAKPAIDDMLGEAEIAAGTFAAGSPWAICFSPPPDQVLYVSDAFPGRIYKVTPEGELVGVLGLRQEGPALVEKHRPFRSSDMLKRVPLIHDESLASRAAVPSWADWFAAAGVRDADVSRGLRFSTADHALDATVEGAGVLLAFDALAYDDLRTGRLVAPVDLALTSGRCYSFVCPAQLVLDIGPAVRTHARATSSSETSRSTPPCRPAKP
jgi:DNA-binding transcriptional LysR family regulator